MKQFGKFTEYVPPERLGGICIHIRTAEGLDWYDAVKTFSNNTYKLGLNERGIIMACQQDATMLWPYDLSVVEVPIDLIPEEVASSLCLKPVYQYKDGKVIDTRL